MTIQCELKLLSIDSPNLRVRYMDVSGIQRVAQLFAGSCDTQPIKWLGINHMTIILLNFINKMTIFNSNHK